jgi:hypothetical protein
MREFTGREKRDYEDKVRVVGAQRFRLQLAASLKPRRRRLVADSVIDRDSHLVPRSS